MLPKTNEINNKFGKYKITYSFSNDNLKTIRFFEQETNSFPPSDYPELVKFYDEMSKSDRAKVVLVKKD